MEVDLIELDAVEKLYDLTNPYDILFLDIRFGNRSIGIDIAEELRNRGNTSIIILTTAMKSMSIDGYRAEPFRFIVKPFTEEEAPAVPWREREIRLTATCRRDIQDRRR